MRLIVVVAVAVLLAGCQTGPREPVQTFTTYGSHGRTEHRLYLRGVQRPGAQLSCIGVSRSGSLAGWTSCRWQ